MIITDRGRPAHVLLSYAEFERITGPGLSIVDVLGTPVGVECIEIEFPRALDLASPADFA